MLHDILHRRFRQPMSIAIITDSSACLPTALVREHGITVVPLALLIDGEVIRDGALPSLEFYARLDAARRPPSTAAPAPGEFLGAFRCARDWGAAAALCLTLSAEYSGTYSSAMSAQALAAREMLDLPVRVVDTRGLAMAHGFAVLAAARVAAAGGSLGEVAAAAETVAAGAHLVGALSTTRYLAKTGRVPWVVHWTASLLRIKPVLAACRSKVRAVGRARTMSRAAEKMLAYFADRVAPGAGLHVAVMHANDAQRAEELAALVRQRFSPTELLFTEFTSVMGVHTGPGFVGLAFYAEGGQ